MWRGDVSAHLNKTPPGLLDRDHVGYSLSYLVASLLSSSSRGVI